MYGEKGAVCNALTLDIYNALNHGKFSKENYSVSQICLTKGNALWITFINIPEDKENVIFNWSYITQHFFYPELSPGSRKSPGTL